MISQCPQCRRRITDFAVSCSCGWSMVESHLATDAVQRQAVMAGTDQVNAIHSTSDPSPDALVSASDSSIDLTGNHLPASSSDSSTSLIINGSASLTSANMPREESDEVVPPSQVELQIQKAKELIGEEEFSKSLGYLSRAIADAPTERLAECYSLRGYIYYRQGDVVRAEEECTKAINENWEDANTYAWRAAARGEQAKWRLAFDDLQAACDIAGGNRDEYLRLMESYSKAAKSYFLDLIKAGEDTADMFSERGWIYYRCSKATKAERDFKQALARDENHGWAAMGLALVHREAGVSQHLSRLLEVALSSGDVACQRLALQNCAELHWARGDVSAANRDLQKLTLLAGDDPQSIVEVSRIRSQMGDHVQAIEQLGRLLEEHPDEHFAWLVRAQCYEAIKNYPLAIRDYSRFLRIFPEHVDALVHRAFAYFSTRKFKRAHEDLDVAEEVQPANYEVHLLRAKVLLSEDALDTALTECQDAARLDNRAEVFSTQAKIYHKLCDYSAAIEEYSRAIEMARGDVEQRGEYLYQRGTLLYELEDFEKAFDDFEAACELRPNHSGSWVWKAATASRLEDWTAAIESLQNAIEARPAAAAAYQKLGKPVAHKAVEFFDRQDQRSQSTQETYRTRGMAHQFLGDHTKAIADFTRVLESDPNDMPTRILRGQSLAASGQHRLAHDDFTAVIDQQPDNHLARYCRAISRKESGKLNSATLDIRKAIKLAPEHPKYHILLSEFHSLNHDPRRVIRSLDKAVLRDPTDPLTYRRRAQVHMNQGDLLRAIRDFTHAIELDPSQFEALVTRGYAHLKSDQSQLALEDFELALTHNPRLAKAYSGRASVLVSEGRLEYTLIWLTKAIHRFEDARDLAEILFARGKVFAQMGRFAPATADFSAVIDLVRTDPKTLIAARHARALTNIQAEKFEKAAKDYRRINKLKPNDKMVQNVLAWLSDPTKPRPEFLGPPQQVKRPTRPPVVRAGVPIEEETAEKWQNEPPHDTWIVRNQENKEYGPVHFNILKNWIESGRIDLGMKLLRADWSKWKRAEKIFPEILPFHGPTNFVEDFPGIEL